MASMSPLNTVGGGSAASPGGGGSVSPHQTPTPKNVAFELLFLDSPQYRARLPMRVQIYPHDTTDSIVTTVKNFYGLYSGPTGSKGVSFEDEHGNTLIARYENFRNNMVVYVRVIEEPPANPAPFAPHPFHAAPGAQAYYGAEGFPVHAPQRFAQDISRPGSPSARRRSPSPNARGRRSDSASTSSKKSGRSRSAKNRGSVLGQQAESYSDSLNGYSSGDGAPSSASGRNKDQLGTTDISVENIVEGGRRKRAKFESSELPLFAPPQMPAATSNPSVSPARRVEPHRPVMPFVQPGQNPFTNPRPIQTSPQGYSNGSTHSHLYATPGPERHRPRGSIGYPSNGNGMGILPTPDPTVGSCMSEEDKDVAIQLMRLGDMSNISHGRTSASTLDDTFSGRADATSSTGATSEGESDSESELPPARRQKLDAAGTVARVFQTTESRFMPPQETTEASGDDGDYNDSANDVTAPIPKSKPVVKSKPAIKHKSSSSISKPVIPKVAKAPRPPAVVKTKQLPPVPPGPMSPASMPPSRKQSIVSVGQASSLAPGDDDHPDLSTKPRCQRCRKSKKGCDRQRPCGRCKDAGLSAEQCISEDEGNGRKGRYGRHMGVPIKQTEVPVVSQPALLPAAPIAAAGAMVVDKAKKRKR